MAIHRIKKERDYVVLDNTILRDPNLSWKAKGVLAYALSRPEDWVFSIRGLAWASRDGEDSTRSAVQELEKAGYIVRKRKRIRGKYQEMEYEIYEQPVRVLPVQEISSQGKPKQEKSELENQPEPNTDLRNIELPNTDNIYNPSTNPEEIERLIRNQIEYEIMHQRYDRRQLDDLVSIMTEVMLCGTERIVVSKDKSYPAFYVRNCIAKIRPLHIEQILETLLENRPEVRNIRAYLLTALINAANTLEMGFLYGEGYKL